MQVLVRVSGATFTVPAEVASCVREGLRNEIEEASEEITKICQLSGEWPLGACAKPFGRQDAARALLEAIGAMTPDPPADIEVNLNAHRSTLLRALKTRRVAALDALKHLELDPAEQSATTNLAQRLQGVINIATKHQ